MSFNRREHRERKELRVRVPRAARRLLDQHPREQPLRLSQLLPLVGPGPLHRFPGGAGPGQFLRGAEREKFAALKAPCLIR